MATQSLLPLPITSTTTPLRFRLPPTSQQLPCTRLPHMLPAMFPHPPTTMLTHLMHLQVRPLYQLYSACFLSKIFMSPDCGGYCLLSFLPATPSFRSWNLRRAYGSDIALYATSQTIDIQVHRQVRLSVSLGSEVPGYHHGCKP